MNRFVCMLLFSALLLSSCGVMKAPITKADRYARMYEEKPVVLLVMPPINNSANVEAKELLYTSISRPLAEAGYYVLSPLLAMDVLKSESAYDSELFFDAPLTSFNKYFGADAVVFSVIDSWTKSGFGIRTTIRYVIKSALTGDILFDRTCDLYLDLQQTGSQGMFGALADLVTSAINTAVTDHIVAARKANYFIFRDLPKGKYSPDYMLDKDSSAEPEKISATVK